VPTRRSAGRAAPDLGPRRRRHRRALYAELAGPRAFTLDIGGTSTDIGLILEGGQQYASEFQIDFGIPVTIPCVAVRTIGAGGGSIAWIDKGGLLHVGPQSAGAEPGPVAYGRGGEAPTVTDANLVLGRLDPAFFLGGAMPLDLAAAWAALARLGEALSLSAEDAALAVIRTVDENMANAIRLIAVERGLDIRDFALIAFGGAGPLHARSVAERLGMTSVIVPPHPGLCSAFGAAIAEARVDRVQTLFTQSDSVDVATLAEALKRLRLGAVEELRRSVDVAAPESAARPICAMPARTTSWKCSFPRARWMRPAGRRCWTASPRPMPSNTASLCPASRSS
jgi:N-methylhydantoinase A